LGAATTGPVLGLGVLHVMALGALLLVTLALGRLRPVVVLRLLGAPAAVRLAPLLRGGVAVLESAEPRLLPGKVFLGARPRAGVGSLLLVGRAVGMPSSEGRCPYPSYASLC
jgi:hypothetical protein